MTRAGRRIREQYADTGGFTDHVFAVASRLGYRFIPRIRDLPSKRRHVFEPRHVPKPLIGLTGNKIREDVIVRNWPDILRVAATLASGALPPSQLLRKFAAYPRQHELAVTLREIGRVERTLFIRTLCIVDWLLDADMQRRANTGLNKGEAHHALKNALRIGRQGEIRDRSSEGQHYRMAGLNLLATIVIYWNTAHLGETVRPRKHAGLTVEPELLAHISPLGWAVGPHPAHWRIPVAKTPIATLAYDSAPYRNRPECRPAHPIRVSNIRLTHCSPGVITTWSSLDRTGSRYRPLAAIFRPQRRSTVSSMPNTNGSVDEPRRPATSSNRARLSCSGDHRARLSTW